jgi:hypothetical protein
MTTVLFTAFAVAYAVPLIASGIQSLIILNFLGTTPRIATAADLERFKGIARLGMYLALLAIPFLLVGLVSGVIIIIVYGMKGLFAAILANMALLVGGKLAKRVEVRVRNLEVSSEELAAEYQRIGVVWIKKALPDF